VGVSGGGSGGVVLGTHVQLRVCAVCVCVCVYICVRVHVHVRVSVRVMMCARFVCVRVFAWHDLFRGLQEISGKHFVSNTLCLFRKKDDAEQKKQIKRRDSRLECMYIYV